MALQATDQFMDSTLSTAEVTVTDVAPTAAVTNSGAVEESPVTFTVSNVQDLNPNDTVTYLADWTGSGQFQLLTPDQLTTGQNGAISFTHVYADGGTYNAVVELVDGDGGVTAYTTPVSVTEAPPTIGSFGPVGQPYGASPTTPFAFSGVTDVSPEEAAGPFTYYVSVDGGAYVGSSSPTSTPLSGLTPDPTQWSSHTVSGYVVDGEGQSSAVLTSYVYLAPSDYQQPVPSPVILNYSDTGAIAVDWAGNANGPVTLSGYGSYTTTSASGLTVTLLDPNSSYTLTTNGAFDLVQAAAGVTNVTLSVNTATNSYGFPGAAVGDGRVGEIDLPTGSTVSVDARGDLGSIVGPSGGSSVTHAQAGNLSFANLDGSITGLDSIGEITATGWLGTSASQQVAVNGGIGYLSAYGVGATVQADLRMDVNDEALWLSVGAGGVTGTFDAGVVGNAQIAGNVNVFEALSLSGAFSALAVNELALAGSMTMGSIKAQSINLLLAAGNATFNGNLNITGLLGDFLAPGNLKVGGAIEAGHIGTLQVGGALQAGSILSSTTIDHIDVGGAATITNGVFAVLNIGDVKGGGDFQAASIWSLLGSVGPINVQGNLRTSIVGLIGVGPITVTKSFTVPTGREGAAVGYFLVHSLGSISDITAGFSIGVDNNAANNSNALIEGGSVGVVNAGGDIALSMIRATAGSVAGVIAGGNLWASVESHGGDVQGVKAKVISRSLIRAYAAKVGGVITGGNIWYVTATSDILSGVVIWADELVGTVKIVAPTATKEAFTVRAQGGATFNAAGVPTRGYLTVNVGNAQFLGQIVLTPTPLLADALGTAALVPYYYLGANTPTPLVQLTDSKHAGTQWNVGAPAGAALGAYTTVKAIEFNWNNTTTGNNPKNPGLQPGASFTDVGWSVQGPAM